MEDDASAQLSTLPPELSTLPAELSTLPPELSTLPTELSTLPPELSTLPPEVLVAIASGLLPVAGLAEETWQSWRDALFFSAASQLTHAAVLEAARERMPVAVGTADMGAAAFAAHIGALLCGGGRSAWQVVRPLRAVRAQTSTTTPLQAAPRLAGATLCAVAPSRLCLFGGRDSASGDTLDATHLAQIRGGVAIWDALQSGGQVR